MTTFRRVTMLVAMAVLFLACAEVVRAADPRDAVRLPVEFWTFVAFVIFAAGTNVQMLLSVRSDVAALKREREKRQAEELIEKVESARKEAARDQRLLFMEDALRMLTKHVGGDHTFGARRHDGV